MTKIYKKLVTAFWCGLAAFSASAFEHGLMRIPDSFAPRREVVVNGEGYENAVTMPLPGDGSMMLQNEMGGGVLSLPIPVRAGEAVEAFLEKFPKGKVITAEVSGTTWFAQALDEAGFISFYGPIVVKGYCFVLYLRTPANRGLDATVRAMLRQITLLPPKDGNSEPTIPLVKMDLAKVPPVEDIPNWHNLAKAHKRTVEKAAATEPPATVSPTEKPQSRASSKDVPLPPLPSVVTAPKAQTVKPILSDDFMNATTRKAAIAHVRESLRELVGPMSDEANAAFEKHWNAVADYPAPEILDWLKKASPIISEQVRLKAAVDAGIVACDDALREAAYAQAFGNAAAEREQMRAYAEILTAMKTAQARMNALQKQLDKLGGMPDPKELAARDDAVRKAARQTVGDLLGSGGGSAAADAAEPAARGQGKSMAPAKSPAVRPFTTGTSEGYWELVDKRIELGKTGPGNNPLYFDRYSGGDLNFNYTGTFDSDKDHEKWSFEATCSAAPPRLIKGDETLTFTLSVKTAKTTYLFAFADASMCTDEPTVGPGSCTRARVRAVSDDDKKWKSVSACASTRSDKPTAESATFKLKVKKGHRPKKMADGKIEPDRIGVYFKACSCCTCWVYEWREGEMPPESVAPAAPAASTAASAVADFPQAEDAPDTPEAKEERIAFHRRNIEFIEGTIARLEMQLAEEKDSSRRAELGLQLIRERSNVIYEQDRIRAEETGVFTASRTPFDEMCQIQQRANTLRQVREAERLNSARRKVEFLMSKMPPEDWDDAIRTVTGGRGIMETINDMTDLFRSLVL